jgi:hypothetical protein
MGKKRKVQATTNELQDTKRFCKTCSDRGCDASTPYHERVSNKACPYYQPRLARRNNVAGLSYSIRTVKIGLNVLLRRQSLLLPRIQDFVRRMTRIQYEASRLANLFVLHELENGNTLGDLSYNVFMRQVFQAVTRVSETAEHRPKKVNNNALQFVRDTLYAPARQIGLPWNDQSHLGQCISNAAKAYATNCQNHVILNWEARITRWWAIELKTRLPFLNANQRKRMAEVFLSGQSVPPAFRSFNDQQIQDISITFDVLSQECKGTILGELNLPLDMETLASRWWILLPSLWRLLNTLETGNRSGFTMLPIMNATAKYVHFDNDAFHSLLRFAEVPKVPGTAEKFREPVVDDDRAHLPPEGEYPVPAFPDVRICDHWWAWAFKVNKVSTNANSFGGSSGKTGARSFGYHVATDGLSASVQVRVAHPVWEAPAVNSYGFDEEETYHPLDIGQDDRVIGLDLGRISPFVGVYGEGRRDKVSCSKAEYRQRAGFTEAQRTRTRWMKNAPEIQRINTSTPTAKTARSAIFLVHLRYALFYRDRLCTFYGAQRWLRLRWKSHIAKEKTWEIMIRRITNGDPRTIVALGDGDFAHNSPGHPSMPTKAWRQRLRGRCRLRMIDEYRTSIVCSLCEGALPKRTRFWQVKVCPDICLTTWNRDVNAARNIRAIFLHMNSMAGQRPYVFQREEWHSNPGMTLYGPRVRGMVAKWDWVVTSFAMSWR